MNAYYIYNLSYECLLYDLKNSYLADFTLVIYKGNLIIFFIRHSIALFFNIFTASFCILTGSLFGVFDGHAGQSCAEVLSKKLFKYIATVLLPETTRDNQYKSKTSSELVEYYRDTGKVNLSVQEDRLYEELRLEWTNKLKRTRQNFTVYD